MDGWLASVRREHYLLTCKDDNGLKALRAEMAGTRSALETMRTQWARHVYETQVRPRDELQQLAATAAREAAELFREPQLDARKYLGAQRAARDAEVAAQQEGHARRVYRVPEAKPKRPEARDTKVKKSKKGGATSAADVEKAEETAKDVPVTDGSEEVAKDAQTEDVKVIEITMPASLAEKKGMDKGYEDEDIDDDYVLFDKPDSDDDDAFSEIAIDEDDDTIEDDDADHVRAVDVDADQSAKHAPKKDMLSFVKVG